MIQLYQKGQADFSANGIELHPVENEVNWQDGGRYDFSMTIPREAAEGITFDYGQFLKVSVPPQHIGQISLGTVSYYTASAGAKLYSQMPKSVAVSYSNWQALRSYMAGDKVTYDKKNWQCVTGHGGLSVPPPNGGLWTQIASSRMDEGKTIATLESGTTVMKVRDFNSTYMEVATLNGLQGYIRISECTATGESEERTIPAFDISEQYFTINHIDKETDAHNIRIEAEHISYQLGRTILGECKVVGVSPATALLFIAGAMQEEYPGGLYCGIDDGAIDADWSWKNAQSAILDPQNGLLKAIAARAIRDNQDVYIVPNAEGNPTYEVRYGVNMKSVKWTGDINGIVTRIYPIAQREDGTRLMLPEKHIDTVRDVPYVRPEVLDTKLKIGQKVTNSDGTEVELTEDEVITRMRQAAQDRFNIDRCDMAEVTLELDWVHMPDTEEYRQYISLINAAPSEWVRVEDGPMGVSTIVQLTSYVWDAVLLQYKKTGFGDKKQKPSVAGYDIKSGAVTNRALAAGSVGSENIVAGSITAREIEAGSITAEQIASKIITAALIAAEAITADEIAAQAITTVKLAAGSVTAEKIAAGAVTADSILAGTITSALIAAGAITAEQIAANAVTAEKIAAGAVTATSIAAGAIETEKLAAYAITSAKIAAGAIETDKLAAGAVTADKISATDLDAINAKLGTATIANAQIATADINFAHIKDLNAQSAYFGQTIFDEGIGGKLYVPRLNVGYAQMVGATIGDLVIQASNGNFYGIDVDMNGNVTATQRTVTAGEIAAGHTTDGRTLVLGTDILATDLTTENIYASHALMNEITAATISVDELWARTAFIGKLMTTDISSNTYIQATIGNWTSGSTITQSINSLNSRISELGYGTVYFQPNAPDPSHLTEGDIWVKSSTMADWQDVYNTFADWQAVYNAFDDWQTLCAVDRMFVWTGVEWKEMYDADLPTSLQTEINQLASEITLKASMADVDFLAGEVTEFSAQLTVQAQEIQSAVSAVNLKAASYVMQADPRTAYTVSVGDIWVKWDGVTDWQDIFNRYDDWQAIYDTFGDWSELTGSKSYVWNGTEWVETSDRASEIYQKTLIDQTINEVTILAEASAVLNDELIQTRASITVTNSAIEQEVIRATTAEGGKMDKTTQYQTADAIVTEAVSRAASNAIARTTTYQTADAIVSEAVSQAASAASGAYIAKTTVLQTATQIVNEAVSQAASAASGTYIAKTTNLQTADAIKNEAVRLSGVAAAAAYIAKTANYANVDAIIAQAQTLANNAANTAKNASIAKTSTYQTADTIVNAAVAQAATAAGQTYIAKTASYQTADAIVNAARSYVDGELTDYSTTTQTSAMISQYVGNNAYGKISGITIESAGIDVSGSQYVKIASGGYFRVTSGNFGIKSDAGTDEYVIWSGASTAANSQFRVKKNGAVTLTKLMILNESGTETEVNLRTYGLWKLNYHVIKSYTDSGGYVTSMVLSNGQTVNFKSAAAGWAEAAAKVGDFSVTAGSGIVALTVPASTEGSTTQKSGTITLAQGNWSNGSKLITAYFGGSEARTATVDIGNASGWSATYVPTGQMSVSCFVAGKAFSSGAIEDPGYKAGWNAYRAALVNTMGGKTNLAKEWTYRGNLYSAPQQGAQYYRDCYNGLTFADIPDAM